MNNENIKQLYLTTLVLSKKWNILPNNTNISKNKLMDIVDIYNSRNNIHFNKISNQIFSFLNNPPNTNTNDINYIESGLNQISPEILNTVNSIKLQIEEDDQVDYCYICLVLIIGALIVLDCYRSGACQ